jgi:hypothetical protein
MTYSIPVIRYLHIPHNAAHKMSDENFFLYLRISGVSLRASDICCVGATLTLICDPLRDDCDVMVEPSDAPNPKAVKDRGWCLSPPPSEELLTACRY